MQHRAMNEREYFKQNVESLTSNPKPRVAVALCLDNSGSMGGEPIRELNEGVRAFYEGVLDDKKARSAVEVCMVTFDYEAVVVRDYCDDITKLEIPRISTRGGETHIGEGVNKALDMLERRKEEYKAAGADYYQPWLVLMTDGEPYGEDKSVTQKAMQRASAMVKDGKLVVIPIGIGDEADRDTLRGFSPEREPMKLQGLKFKEFFTWLSRSACKVANTKDKDSTDIIQGQPDGVQSWGTLRTGGR